MNGDKPFVHFIALNKEIYLFDVNTNMISRVNERIYRHLMLDEDISVLNADDEMLLENMKRAGMLKPDQIEKIEHPMTNFVEDIIENNMTRLTLQVTQNCNFRCEYCVYSGSYHNRVHNNKRMDWDTAKKALDFIYEHSKNTSEMTVSFYGGEPLLEIELIKQCVNYAKNIFKGKILRFNLTTNASLLTDDIILYMQKEKFLLTISLDGPKEVHDKNRSFADGKRGTYDVVMDHIMRIKDIAPDFVESVTFNAVLDDENDFREINRYFMENSVVKDMIVSTNYINDVNRKDELTRNNEENYLDVSREKFRGMMYLLGRFPRERVSKLVVREITDIDRIINKRLISKQVIPTVAHPGGPCLPGTHRPFVNAYGKIFPCERVNETCGDMCIGDIYSGFDLEAIKKLLNVGKMTETACKQCWAFNFCTQCGVMADDGEKMAPEVRLEKCGRIRNSVDNMIKDYIVLKECGCDFTNVL